MAKKADKYSIFFTAAGSRDLKRLKGNAVVKRSINATIAKLEDDPRPHGSKNLGGTAYRVRDGEYRIVYDVNDTTRKITITKVRDRKEVYKH